MSLEELLAMTGLKSDDLDFILRNDKGATAVYIDHETDITVLIPHRLLLNTKQED